MSGFYFMQMAFLTKNFKKLTNNINTNNYIILLWQTRAVTYIRKTNIKFLKNKNEISKKEPNKIIKGNNNIKIGP